MTPIVRFYFFKSRMEMDVVRWSVPAIVPVMARPKHVCQGKDCESRFYSIRSVYERSKLEWEISCELDDETRHKMLKHKWR